MGVRRKRWAYYSYYLWSKYYIRKFKFRFNT